MPQGIVEFFYFCQYNHRNNTIIKIKFIQWKIQVAYIYFAIQNIEKLLNYNTIFGTIFILISIDGGRQYEMSLLWF